VLDDVRAFHGDELADDLAMLVVRHVGGDQVTVLTTP
jgi:hypothetical protein